ncbi:MAG: acyloxyacyl hydrolase [Candidatus Cyclobacteriaceae bacterium M2_1C_046]
MQRIVFIAFFLLLFHKAVAQPSYTYGITPYYGAVLRYKPEMPAVKFSNLYGAEAYILKQTDGTRYWEERYNYPKLGLAVSYFNYGEPAELGEVVSLTGFIDIGLKSYKRSELRFSLGTGLVYSSVIYDSEFNPDNKAVGAKISYVLRGNLYYTYHLNELWDVNFNFTFRHYSNGRMNMPNNGMNFPAVGIGASYSPDQTEYKTPEKEQYSKGIRWSLFGSAAWREVYYDDYKHKAYSASFVISKRITWYNSLLIGLDGFYYTPESVRRHFTPRGVNLEIDEIDGRQVGITFGNEIYFGKLAFLIQGGIYIYDPHKIWKSWYQRYALKYYVHENGFIQIGLKSHTRTANMVEWGLGVRL